MRITLDGRRPDWVRACTNDRLVRRVPADTLQRARSYAQDGKVTELDVDEDGDLSASVQGSGAQIYRVSVEHDPDGSWRGWCNCPIRFDCKHVVAVVLATRTWLAREEQSTATSPWERQLSGFLTTTGPVTPLALVFERAKPLPHSGLRIRLRPVLRSDTGRWIKTGAGWNDITSPYGNRTWEPAQAAALRALHAAYRLQLPPYGYGSYGETVHLDELGARCIELLSEVVRSGVELMGGDAWQQITVASEPAEVLVDLTATDDGCALSPQVRYAGERLTGLTLVGSPAHGLVLDRDGTLLLAALDRRLTPAVDRLLKHGPVPVPPAELPTLLRTYYPALRRQVTVISSDASVALPEIAPPRLALDVRLADGHTAALSWAIAYAIGDEAVRLPLDSPSPHAVRDPAAERLLLADVDTSCTELAGVELARWVEDVLPQLRANETVDATVYGELRDYRQSLDAPVVSLALDDSPRRTDWFDLDVSVTVSGQDVPVGHLIGALVNGEAQLLLESGTWFSLDRPELDVLRHVLADARELADPETGLLRLSAVQAGFWDELVSLGVVTRQSERWSRTVGGLLEVAELPDPALPVGLKAELRPYQRAGYRWLSLLWDLQLGGVLADDMGLGKTVQVLAMLARAVESGTAKGPLLVVAPTSVVGGWVEQAQRFVPDLDVRAVTSTVAKSRSSVASRVEGADLVVTSYALLRLDEAAFGEVTWSGLVLDEAQFVKNHQARTYKAARSLDLPFTLVVTGTPLENSLMDLWSMLSLAAPGLYPSPKRFAEDYRRPIESGQAPEQLVRLRRHIRPFLLRRTKDQVALDLPPKVEQVLAVELNAKHRKAYDRQLQRERQRVLGLLDDLARNRIAILSALTTLRQLTLDAGLADPALADIPSSKLDVLLEQLTEVVAEGHRVLVFSQFTRLLALVRTRLDAAGIAHEYLDGRTRDRPRRIAAFEQGSSPVFLISLKAGGTGLNLTAADYVFVLDPWWNPAVEAQAVDRAHRLGQTRTVMVYRLVASDTIEEKVVELQQRKRELFDRVVDDGAALSGALTADDIRGLLS